MGKSKYIPEPGIRQQAEEKLKLKSAGKKLNSEADTLKLIHELEVHQIELELINEELRKAKEQAEVIAEKYAELYYAPLGYFTISDEGLIKDLNFNGAQMLGKPRSSLLNKNFSRFVTNDTKSTFDIFLKKIFIQGTIISCEVTLSFAEKKPVHVYLNGLVRENNQHCQLIAVDITERKVAEKQNERLMSELRTAQSKLGIALENGNIGIWEYNLETEVLDWDERTEKMFGLKPGSFGRTMKDFENLINEEDISHIQAAMNHALQSHLPFETVFRTRNEKKGTKFISSKAHINRDENRKPLSLTGVFFDVTGLKEGTEQLMLKLNEELLRSNMELESFAYIATHDLQEPLRMVSSFTQLLSMQYEDKLDDKAREYIKYAVDGAKRMYDLLNGLLAYSRINTRGKVFSNVNINIVLENVTKNLSLIIRDTNATIKTDKLPVVFADENQMIHLFQNLIANSIKFSIGTPEIYISVKQVSDYFVFSVKDNGIGIESRYFDRIFQIFQRLMPKEQYDGTGIGLAICKRIVEHHEGKIWVESVPGKGSTFFFTIPGN